jgi:CheY-like chemotaxis protein/HPt (histidine-containing phosphotransfer) domain-containing protein
VVAGLKPQAEQKGVGLEIRISGHPSVQVLGDSLRLRQILINLTNNAIKFTAKGVVTLAVERQDALSEPGRERIRFAVIDTGIGIAPERQEEIFKPFTQADESTTRRYGGTGLGTTIAYQLVALMGGRLTVASQPEQGATFSFVITLAVDGSTAEKTSENRLVVPVAGTSMIAPACILVAEDTPVNQLVIRRHLESQGHIVSLVGTGREAVAACRARDYDLVLMDVQMPYLDGIQATRQIRGDLCGRLLPILALTANTDAQTRTDCEAAGMDAVLTKPIRREPLLAAVRQWLNQRKGLAPDPFVKTDDVDHGRYVQPDMPLDVNTVIYEFGDSATAREVIEHLLESLPGYSEAIRQACITGDLAAIRKHAHAIKGAAASVEANPLSRAAAVLEDHCRQNASGQVAEAVAGMIASMEDLTRFVRTMPWPPVPR